ncbi:MAG: ParB/RepB/Spo0J family partition protein [Aigarchaeota archaeon]|nr:ParB/RepB/Spo0J family partition protein [Aigarchaeota archaeon]MDW7986616.1 ParB/RepB/Spo0J family partition protein [Nitrososphaerota archaeon]
MEVQWIPVNSLKIADYNPREVRSPEIIQGIIETYRSKKIIKPLLVRKIADEEYEVFDGGTRLEALKLLNVDKAPCLVYECNRKEAIEIAAIIHTNREELTSAEKGKFILRCINEGVWKNVEEASRGLGISKDTIYDWIKEAKIRVGDSFTHLKKILNKDVRRSLAMMPKPVRDKVIEELSTLREEIIEKIKRDLPSILKEIADVAGDIDTDEVIKDFRLKISSIIESGSGYLTRFKGSSGLFYEIEEVEDNILIKVSGKSSIYQQLTIPRIDVKEFVRKLSRFTLG